ncbi:MAG TPA: LiaF domain-containing protein [Vicinamibacteria bacterium]|nr:LiaF domain-containing protein [Vicinamibacteria bacterium]
MRSDRAAAHIAFKLVLGSGILLLGLLLTLDNFGLLEARRFIRLWPALLIGLGLAKLSHGWNAGTRSGASFLILLGTGLLLVNLQVLQGRLVLALFYLVLGTVILWRAVRAPRPVAPPPDVDPSRVLDVSSLMGSVERGMSTPDFRGGSVSAVMAACEIDLRKASIESGEVVLNAFAMWGGIEIKVPSDWSVESRGVAVMGAFEDSSRRPDDVRKKLIVTGYALMGGVEVKN